MEKEALKRKMAALWKDTFSDSEAYVDLVLDNYFNPDLIAWHEEGGRLISALLGIPYEFKSSSPSVPPLKGLYLCGLATVPSHRGRGLMSRLIEEINEKATRVGFDFSFLIPASEELTFYYEHRNYLPAFFYYEENYVSDHDFEVSLYKQCVKNNEQLRFRNFENLRCVKINFKASGNSLVDDFNPELPEKLISFLNLHQPRLKKAEDEKAFALYHNYKDWELAVRENIISGDMIFICNENSIIKGVAFATMADSNHIKVKKIVTNEKNVKIKLLDSIKKHFPQKGMSVVSYVNELINDDIYENQIWRPFYIQNNNPQAEYEDVSIVETLNSSQNCTKPFGMCRILNESEILKKVVGKTFDDKFSILANESKYLLRKPSTPDYIWEAFKLPELNLSAFILLE